MKKATSTLVLLIFGLCILACSRKNMEPSSGVSEITPISKMNETSVDENKTNNFVSYSHYSTLKSITDDEREL
ncbi:hypothetical protein [Flagellimonas sp. S3867]|uniref:hypothetical protein n=1 Tax=Flagellimonas sp. S3867 TaxID=2768063 RepID=UPI0016820A53|nr:hypothetical protein [Flagellimonas sp. S3867]